jgi:hypothetical protein
MQHIYNLRACLELHWKIEFFSIEKKKKKKKKKKKPIFQASPKHNFDFFFFLEQKK